MARSVAPSSSAPASDVTMPASNAATTSRPSTGSNPNKSGIHSVGIGALRDSARNDCGTTLFADSPPRCTQFGEKSALDMPDTRSGAKRLAAYPISDISDLAKSAQDAKLILSQRLSGHVDAIRRI